jgi:opacity protein-like surface antigen
MKLAHLSLAAALCAAAGAQAQLVEPAGNQLQGKPQDQAFEKSFQPYPRPYMKNDATQLDPRVFKDYRSDPKLSAGYEVAPHVAVEAGYTGLNSEGPHPIDPGDAAGRAGAGNTKGFGTYVAGKVDVPLGEKVLAYGKLGVAYSERNDRSDLAKPTLESKESDVGAYVSAGTEYKLSDKATLSGKYERYGNSAKKFGSDTNAGGVSAKLNVGF